MKRSEGQKRHGKGALPNLCFRYPRGENLPFEINSFESLPKAAQAGYPHRQTFYEIDFVTHGKGEHVVDFEPVTLQPPTLSFISPGQVHFWRLDEPLKGKVILFTPDFLALASANHGLLRDLTFIHGLERRPHLNVRGEFHPVLTNLVDKLEQEYQHHLFGRASVLRSYLHILLAEIQRRFEPPGETGRASAALAMVRQFKRLVAEEFLSLRSPRDYADKMGVSPGHLSDTLKALTGRSAGEHIREEISLEAKRLLAHTDRTIAEIAFDLNFEDPSYFGRFFKRETGVSPKSFRQQIREKYQTIRDGSL